MPTEWDSPDAGQPRYEVVKTSGPDGSERMGVMPMDESTKKAGGTNVFKNLSRQDAQELADIFNEAFDSCCYFHLGDDE